MRRLTSGEPLKRKILRRRHVTEAIFGSLRQCQPRFWVFEAVSSVGSEVRILEKFAFFHAAAEHFFSRVSPNLEKFPRPDLRTTPTAAEAAPTPQCQLLGKGCLQCCHYASAPDHRRTRPAGVPIGLLSLQLLGKAYPVLRVEGDPASKFPPAANRMNLSKKFR